MQKYTVIISYDTMADLPGECYTHHANATTVPQAVAQARDAMSTANDHATWISQLPVIAVFHGHLEHLE